MDFAYDFDHAMGFEARVDPSSFAAFLCELSSWFPHGLENLENEITFPVRKSQGILNRVEMSGNFTQITGKMRKFYQK